METVERLKIELQQAKELVISIQEQIKELEKINKQQYKADLESKQMQKEQRKKETTLYIQTIHTKIRAFRLQVENEGMFLKDVAKKVPCSKNTVAKIVNAEKWDLTKVKEMRALIQKKCLNIGNKKLINNSYLKIELLKKYITQNHTLALSIKEIARIECVPYSTLSKCYQEGQRLGIIKVKTKQEKLTPQKPKSIIVEQPQPKQLKQYKATNQFKSKIEHKPIEWSGKSTHC
jgi:transposase